MLTLSTATARIHGCSDALLIAESPAHVVLAAVTAKMQSRDIMRYIEQHEEHVALLDGDLVDLGQATARLVDAIRTVRPTQVFYAAGFSLDDAAPSVLRLVTRLQGLAQGSPCFEDA